MLAVRLRAMNRCDAAAVREFFESLSLSSRRLRFFVPIRTLGGETLRRMAHFDPMRSVTVLAHADDRLVGVGEYVADPWPQRAEFALAVADEVQRQGVGAQLLDKLSALARSAGFAALSGEVLAENRAMLGLAHASGLGLRFEGLDPRVRRIRLALATHAYPAFAEVSADSDAAHPTMPPWATIISIADDLNCGK